MRKAKPKKRVILPDPVYNDQKVSKFVNHLMYDGKKTISYEIFYKALDTVKEKMAKEEKPALEIWKQALDNITPQVEVVHSSVRKICTAWQRLTVHSLISDSNQ